MRAADFLLDHATGKLSTTRLTRLVGCAVASLMFIRSGWTTPVSAEVWLYYLGVICADASASKLIGARFASRTEAPAEPLAPVTPAPAAGAGAGGSPAVSQAGA